MARRSLPELSPAQVASLIDALLANADRLLGSALALLHAEEPSLARSLAILALEESGKAIALHDRRRVMVLLDPGTPFTDERIRELWRDHGRKLKTVYRFLLDEEYWFGDGPPDPEENVAVLGTIEAWAAHNDLKQQGFYVDTDPTGDAVEPGGVDADEVRRVLARVHQVGWQLRLGEHVEAVQQLKQVQSIPPASEEEIERMRRTLRRVAPSIRRDILASMRRGTPGTPLRNPEWGLQLPPDSSMNIGRRGYEAETRQAVELWRQLHETDSAG